MKFVDEAIIEAKAGHGGAGASHFRREKYVPFGGPDGGTGGSGGSIILQADRNVHTLLDFQYRPLWKAGDGAAGGRNNRSGESALDLVIKVPLGTQVFKNNDDQLIVDIDQEGQTFVLCKGGRGGKGNEFFKTATNQAPQHSQPGEPGEEGKFKLSLKLMADVALVGFPNAGKSTLISRISSAKPKVADYPFTTLAPSLGVVKDKSSRSFVVADIPGLIEGAHEGKGLGITFLKHVERASTIAHLIDLYTHPLKIDLENQDPSQISELFGSKNATEAFEIINHELKSFSESLANKKQVVVLTKIDLISDPKIIKQAIKKFEKMGYKCLAVSSATGKGIEELIDLIASMVFDRK